MAFNKIVTIFFAYYSLDAWSFSVVRENKNLYFLDQSCGAAKSAVTALAEWSKNIGETNYCAVSSTPPIKREGLCGFEITKCAPALLVKYHGDYSPNDGPNCWNSALVIAGILPALRYSAPEEMSFYMNSSLCRPLANNEQRLPGDVGAIRDLMGRGTLETHGFIYVTESLVYSKNEFLNTVPYRLMEIEEMYDDFSLPKKAECRQNRIDPNSDCLKAVAFYRCHSFEKYLQTQSNIPISLHKALDDIADFEHYFEKINMINESLDSDLLTIFVRKIENFANYIEGSDSLLKKDYQFLISNLRLRIFSLSEQLGMLFYIKENQELLDLSLRIKRSSSF